jgi:GntR family transcriptional regulator
MPKEPSHRDRIIADLRERIAAGEWAPGTTIPSLSRLVAEYGTSEQPVRAALDRLVIWGELIGRQGKGYYVPPMPEPPMESEEP